ncbi:MAG: hypothetical protein LBG83_02030 [Oscillospiraceae bacterium]|nr:hypothetical protein [Oscillospiraceae bacterium]
MLKKNYFLRAAVLLLALCTLTASVFLGSGTMAKYYASAEGTASARVAKFSVEVQAVDIAQASSPTFTVNLFDSLKEINGTTAEDHVATSPKLIAPGTGGPLLQDIVVTNKSEVTVNVELQYRKATAWNASLDGKVLVNGSAIPSAWTTVPGTSIKQLDYVGKSGGIFVTTFSPGVNWSWAFGNTTFGTVTAAGGTDQSDTILGVAGAAVAAVDFRIWAEQVD